MVIRLIERLCAHKSQKNGGHAKDDGNTDIQADPAGMSVLEQIDCLEAEGGEGGVAAADADHERNARQCKN
ncbi:hypothetical protein AD953_15400 [Acetobacter malorum]|uniref:Uncharacterized protein n=1 Tax=Acetobacter malorum TaxID=178901 RepID=A0A149V0F0_9PROT|nr:hypothetical protein AD953_15400 [Acetobacter malorum]